MRPKRGRLCQIVVALLIAASPLSCATQRAPSGVSVPDEHDLADVDSNLAALRLILRGYPPKLASQEQRQVERRQEPGHLGGRRMYCGRMPLATHPAVLGQANRTRLRRA